MLGLQHSPPPRWASCLRVPCIKGGPSQRKLPPPRTLDIEGGAEICVPETKWWGTKGSGWLQGPATTSCSVLETMLQFCPLKSFKILVSRKISHGFFLQNHEGSQETSFMPSGTFPPAAQNRWLTTQENRYALVCPQSHQAGNFWVLTTTGYTTVGGSRPTLVSSRGCHSLAVYPGCMSFHFLPRPPILRLE